jgi:hypothetical protein
MSRMKRTWTQTRHKLSADHGWRAKPGYKIFVADQGAIRFDIPASWHVEPGDDSIRFNDKKPPDDDCLLQVSVMYLNGSVDWSGFSITRCLDEALKANTSDRISVGEVVEVKRDGVELAWLEVRFIDENEKREACSRLCYARSTNVPDVVIQPFITMEFWPEHTDRFVPVWNEVLRSLTLGDFVTDPMRRVLH